MALLFLALPLLVAGQKQNPKMFLFIAEDKDVPCDDVRIFPKGIMSDQSNKIDPIADVCSEVWIYADTTFTTRHSHQLFTRRVPC